MLLVGSPLCGSGVGAMGNIYTTPSTDGTNMYVTGLMQVDMANAPVCEEPSNPCARANHTYTQTVKITSPSGRTASCNFQSAYPALTAVNLRCEASLAIDGQGGTYTSSDDQQADCTIAGEFLYAVTPLQNPLIYIVAYYRRVVGVGVVAYYTRCNPNTACPSLYGIPGSYPFFLWTGAQITIAGNYTCVGATESVSQCYSPDPVPGGTPTGGLGLLEQPHRCGPMQSGPASRAAELAGMPPGAGPTIDTVPLNSREDR